MNWIKIAKGLTSFVVSAGVSTIVTNVVRATTPRNIGLLNKIAIGVGGLALSGLVADQAVKYVEKEIDEVLTSLIVEKKEETSQ